MSKTIYEPITSIQQAINMAVAEKRVVRFLSEKSNKDLKKGIIDIKGCKLLKRDRESPDIAVVPEHLIETFDFDTIDTSLVLPDRRIIIP